MGVVLVVFFCLWASTPAVHTTPFLSNAPRALTSLAASASASASNPAEPLTNIADLRVKQQKAQQLLSGKQLVEVEDDNETLQEDEEENNEAAPSLLQKKVNKILTKLRIISSLSDRADNSVSTNNTEKGEAEDEMQSEVGDINNSTEDVATFQKVIYPHLGRGLPLKLRVGLNERQVDEGEEFGDENVKPMGRLEQVGVFFVELLGSIVALAYGAAAQINNTIQGTTVASLD